MKLEQTSKYYDKNVKKQEDSEHKYEELYLTACKILLDNKISLDDPILDIGCGTGAFAKYAKDLGFKKYIGIDFSDKAIERARHRFPVYTFICEDFKTKQIRKLIRSIKTFVCFEVLEHIEDDFSILKMLSENSMFIFSVPNILGHGHVRSFNDSNQVIERYKNVLKFTDEKFTMIKKGKPHHSLFLFKTYKLGE